MGPYPQNLSEIQLSSVSTFGNGIEEKHHFLDIAEFSAKTFWTICIKCLPYLRFFYKDNKMVTNVDLAECELESGMTAVVGGGGEGKTFLMNLLSDLKSDYKVGESYN